MTTGDLGIRGGRWRGTAAALLFAIALGLAPTAPAQAAGDSGTSSGAAMQAAAWLASIPYGAAKLVYAISGGVIGGITYVLSGGNKQAADAVWIPSLYGDYIITPAQLRGQEPIHFVGRENPPPPPAQSAPATGSSPAGASSYPMQQPNEPPAQ